ncbi:hypothetical protein PAEPH01_0615 [Pancytospora epiphaga]|nr:hypothetical protein PAEPH01_0615 [Pancytospora epiphaga]
MPTIVFKGLSFVVCGVKILKNINFKISGIYNLIVSHDDFLDNCIRLYFTHRHIHGATIGGKILIGGDVVLAEDLNLLTNQFRLFNASESVYDVLHFIDPVRAKLVLGHFEPVFSSTLIGVLNIEESRIFEILLSIVSNPPFIFINSLEISSDFRSLCLWLFREYSSESAVLIATEYGDEFDGTILFINDTAHQLNKWDCRKYHDEVFLARLVPGEHKDAKRMLEDDDAPYKNGRIALGIFKDKKEKAKEFRKSCAKPRNTCLTPNNSKTKHRKKYDYKSLYKKYKCENLVNIEKQAHSLSEWLLVYDIYKVIFSDSIKIAMRKYSLMIGEGGRTTGLYKNLNLFIIAVCIFKIFLEIRMNEIREDMPGLICFIHGSIFIFPSWFFQAASILFFKYVIRRFSYYRLLRIVYNIFRRECDYSEFQCLSALVYLAIFYSNGTVFEEEWGFIRFYTNRIMTPGTYVLATFIYLGVTHITVFVILGMVFRIKYIFSSTVNAVSLSMLFACAGTRRLRVCLISVFLTVYLLSLFMTLSGPQEYYFRLFSFISFPPILWRDCSFSGPGYAISLVCIILFHIFVFICCCHKVAGVGEIN